MSVRRRGVGSRIGVLRRMSRLVRHRSRIGEAIRRSRGTGHARARRLRPIHGVDRLQLAILNHSLQDTGVQQLSFADDAIHHLLAGRLLLRLDEAHHADVTSDLDVFAEVEAIFGHAEGLEAEFALFGGFDARLVAANVVSDANVDAERDVGVRLEAEGAGDVSMCTKVQSRMAYRSWKQTLKEILDDPSLLNPGISCTRSVTSYHVE
jgi:hypothetical protein